MTDERESFDAADAALGDVMQMWTRRAEDESRSPRERLAWAEAGMDLRHALARQGYLQYRASQEELDRIEQQHAARVRVGEIIPMDQHGDQVRVTEWDSPWCGFRYEPVEQPGSFGYGVARIECAPDPGLDDRFAEVMAMDGEGEQMLPDDDNPGEWVSLRELVRRKYLAMEG